MPRSTQLNGRLYAQFFPSGAERITGTYSSGDPACRQFQAWYFYHIIAFIEAYLPDIHRSMTGLLHRDQKISNIP